MKNSIEAIPVSGDVSLDYERVAQIYERLSDPLTEDQVFRAVTTLELQIEAAIYAYSAGRIEDVGRVAESMLPVAEELGLLSVEAAARGVHGCADRRDMPGLAATVARLERAGERSLGALTNPGCHPA